MSKIYPNYYRNMSVFVKMKFVRLSIFYDTYSYSNGLNFQLISLINNDYTNIMAILRKREHSSIIKYLNVLFFFIYI